MTAVELVKALESGEITLEEFAFRIESGEITSAEATDAVRRAGLSASTVRTLAGVFEKSGNHQVAADLLASGVAIGASEAQAREDDAIDAAVDAADANGDGVVDRREEEAANAQGQIVPGGVPRLSREEEIFMQTFGHDNIREARDKMREIAASLNLDPSTTIEDFVGSEFFQSNNPTDAVAVVNAWLETDEGGANAPEPAWSVHSPFVEGGTIVLQDYVVQGAQQYLGIDTPQELAKYAQVAASRGLVGQTGQPLWQPLAAVLNSEGYFERAEGRMDSSIGAAGRLNQLTAELQEAERVGPRSLRWGGPTSGAAERAQAYNAKIQELERQVAAARRAARRAVHDESDVLWAPGAAADRLKEGVDLYGQESPFAMFHAMDPELASRLSAQWDGDVENMDTQDLMRASQLMADAGLGGESWDDYSTVMSATGWRDPFVGRFAESIKSAQSRGGGGGLIKSRPDPLQVRQIARDAFRNMFLEDPDDTQLARVEAALNSAIDGAGEGDQVSTEAQIRGALEGMPEYQDLYGNMPAGVTEPEYRAQFDAAETWMLGDEVVGTEAKKLGMRSGDMSTTVGALLNMEDTWDNNTFLGRLATGAKNFRRYL